MSLVLGVDAGGTTTRAAVFTLSGVPVGRGRAAGGNPGPPGVDQASANVRSAVVQALSGVESHLVSGAVFGLAGDPVKCGAVVRRVREELSLPGSARLVGDVVTAFSAGTSAHSGTVLISGTGAIAAKITGHTVTDTADGHGWLLGDDGSAFWLGRAAARATLRALALPPGPPLPLLATLVLRHLLGPAPWPAGTVERLAAEVYARPPLALAELAPLASEAARGGDPVAAAIVAEAAGALAATVAQVHEAGAPLVLAGSVLTSPGPVREAVHELLRAESPLPAGDPAGAAAWLAARPFLTPGQAARQHTLFVLAGFPPRDAQ
jgi:glucosamine kinase